jgi:hypothetical protein
LVETLQHLDILEQTGDDAAKRFPSRCRRLKSTSSQRGGGPLRIPAAMGNSSMGGGSSQHDPGHTPHNRSI